MFTIEKHYIDEMIAHAHQEGPIECCGVLGGRDGRVLKLYQATNAEHSRYCYNIESQDLFRINRECEENGWQFLAIYHSHPDSQAYPSPTDVSAWPPYGRNHCTSSSRCLALRIRKCAPSASGMAKSQKKS